MSLPGWCVCVCVCMSLAVCVCVCVCVCSRGNTLKSREFISGITINMYISMGINTQLQR